jgi:hypothetical protein
MEGVNSSCFSGNFYFGVFMKFKTSPDVYNARMPLNGRAESYNIFQNNLDRHRREFAGFSLQFLLKAVSVRNNANGARFSRPIQELVEKNLPLCFSHLGPKEMEISGISSKLASLSEEMLRSADGNKIFSWAVVHAIKIAEDDAYFQFEKRIHLLFKACAKLCALGKPMDARMFFSSFDVLRQSAAKKLLEGILNAESYPDLHDTISKATSDAQQIKMSIREGIFSGSKH